MRRVLLGLLIAFLVSCGKEPTDVPPNVVDPVLKAKFDLYVSESESLRDTHGFLESDRCDSLLFSSLASLSRPFDILAAHDSATGQWFRSPSHDCYPDQSDSDISRDMILGALWYAYAHKRLDIAQSIWDYGVAHDWTMGRGAISRTKMSPGMRSTLAQLVWFLGGKDHSERNDFVVWFPGLSDYQAHVMVWHILLRQRLYTQIEDTASSRLREQFSRQPENPLFAYAAGNVGKASELLKSSRFWPDSGLPTTANYCDEWPIQRDDDSNGWKPCNYENRTHSGGDLISVAYLLLYGSN